MNIEKNNENIGKIDKKKLLEELAIDIAEQFGIQKEKAQELIKKETLTGIDALKKELNKERSNETKLSDKEVEKLFFTLKGALDVIENSSRLEIKTLKQDIERSIDIETFSSKVNSYLPVNLVEKAKNPGKPHEHVLGFALGSANSIFVTTDILFNIGKGILKTPYHLYMIISGKAKTDSFDKI